MRYYSEEEIMKILQDAKDLMEEEQEFDDSFAKEQFRYYRCFVEDLTQKRVGWKDDNKLYLKERKYIPTEFENKIEYYLLMMLRRGDIERFYGSRLMAELLTENYYDLVSGEYLLISDKNRAVIKKVKIKDENKENFVNCIMNNLANN